MDAATRRQVSKLREVEAGYDQQLATIDQEIDALRRRKKIAREGKRQTLAQIEALHGLDMKNSVTPEAPAGPSSLVA